MSSVPRRDLLGTFAHHRVAANLLMLLMILAGIWALFKLNTQFFPNFTLDIINVQVKWSGAAAEDVETAITVPLEQTLRSLDDLHEMTSTSADGVSAVSLEFNEGTNMDSAMEKVKEDVAQLRSLPQTAEKPEITRVVRYEPVARVLVYGSTDPAGLRTLVRGMEADLLARGIAKITITGLPKQEIAIQIPSARLAELGMTLDQVADRVERLSRDLPAGTVGRDEAGRQLRSLDQRRTEEGFARLPLRADERGRLLRLGDVASIERRAKDGEATVRYDGKPAVELQLFRAEHGDSLKAAHVLDKWLSDQRPRLPAGVALKVFDQSWELIDERINLMLKNGGGGLLVVMAVLFLFLNGRVAWWVTAGIPVSFLATLAILYAAGGSINMISLFALIMALGIIVDDAIVVGEDALTHYQNGEPALTAAEGGARRMLIPVLASSLTTVAAFLPLMLVRGPIGKIMFAIPFVIICVLFASLVESFYVLPGHLRHAFLKMHSHSASPLRQRLETGFDRLRERWFRPLVTQAVAYRGTTIAAVVAIMILCIGLVAGGRVGFEFFPTPEGTVLYANVAFAAGTPKRRVSEFIDQLENTLEQTDKALGGGLVQTHVGYLGMGTAAGGGFTRNGDRFGYVMAELVSPDHRKVRIPQFIKAWKQRVHLPPGVDTFTISERFSGPPGRAIDVRLTGDSAAKLKAAALSLADTLKGVPGVNGIEDDMAYGQEQFVFRLTPAGQALGLTVDAVGRQLRAAYAGRLVQLFQQGADEVEVRVMLPDDERNRLSSLQALTIALPDGDRVPLSSVVTLSARQGFEALRHDQGKLAVHVTADVDRSLNSADRIRGSLEQDVLPGLRARYGVQSSFAGRAADQAETMSDMRRGAVFGLVLIYVILAWVFASYGWPLVVMSAIPFGLVGAVLGHWVMGLDLTLLSLFGLFGLSGIVVNDSIILVTFYKHLRQQGMAVQEAIIEAACQRLRAVLLTSLTTIGGLAPLLFETSLQAQFLIPMAVTISFGLMFSTVLVLLVVPAILSVHESAAHRFSRRKIAAEETATRST
ncbi:MAG: efflux RND transporter permease subunit [Gammaproteobacteria bacterium]|jgi:multidrug efflux pump subunit AcrB